MASWLVHLRIANEFLKYIDNGKLNSDYFLVASIAPDCGVRVADGFNPPSKVTHFSPLGLKRDCQTELFFDKYIKNERSTNPLSFYLGYYIHLKTDVRWSNDIFVPVENKFTPLIADKVLRHKKIKANWCNLDFKYISEAKDFDAYNRFLKINSFEEKYLDFYVGDEINIQLNHIKSYYQNSRYNINLKNEFISEDVINDFVQRESANILFDLKTKLPNFFDV